MPRAAPLLPPLLLLALPGPAFSAAAVELVKALPVVLCAALSAPRPAATKRTVAPLCTFTAGVAVAVVAALAVVGVDVVVVLVAVVVALAADLTMMLAAKMLPFALIRAASCTCKHAVHVAVSGPRKL